MKDKVLILTIDLHLKLLKFEFFLPFLLIFNQIYDYTILHFISNILVGFSIGILKG